MTIKLKSINDALRSALRRYPAVHSAARRVYGAAHMPQALVRRPFQIKNYLSNAGDFTGLQIGAGSHQLPGWLKTDLEPNSTTVYLDATKRFPFAGERFDYIVAEHIIEHIPYEDALNMLRECHRVLKKGGVVRICTPNIELTHRLMHPPLTPELQRYVLRSNQSAASRGLEVRGTFGGADNLDSAIHVANRLHHGYGHRFLYDRDTLIDAFRRSGFVETAECTPGMSAHAALINIDRHATLVGEEHNEVESLIIEAIKQIGGACHGLVALQRLCVGRIDHHHLIEVQDYLNAAAQEDWIPMATKVERPRSDLYGGSGSRASPVCAKSVEEAGPVLGAPEPVADGDVQLVHDAVGEVARLLFMVDHTPSVGLSQ